jgi:hypothetical protein
VSWSLLGLFGDGKDPKEIPDSLLAGRRGDIDDALETLPCNNEELETIGDIGSFMAAGPNDARLCLLFVVLTELSEAFPSSSAHFPSPVAWSLFF